MLPGPYVLQGKSNILLFEKNFATTVVADLCGLAHTDESNNNVRICRGMEFPQRELDL